MSAMIKEEDVKKLAELARIDVSDEEAQALSGDIESILSYVSELQSVSTDDVEAGDELLQNIMREDGEPHEAGRYTEELLSAVPEREGNYVKVKKIIADR